MRVTLTTGMSLLWLEMCRENILSNLFPPGNGMQALLFIFTRGSDSICLRMNSDSYRCCTNFRGKINAAELELQLAARVGHHCMSISCRVFCLRDWVLWGYLKITFSLLNSVHTIHMAYLRFPERSWCQAKAWLWSNLVKTLRSRYGESKYAPRDLAMISDKTMNDPMLSEKKSHFFSVRKRNHHILIYRRSKMPLLFIRYGLRVFR